MADGSFLPSRKKAFSICVLLLIITFTIVMLEGQQQRRPHRLRTWIGAGSGDRTKDTAKGHELPEYAEAMTNDDPNGNTGLFGEIAADNDLPKDTISNLLFQREDAEGQGIPKRSSPKEEFNSNLGNNIIDEKNSAVPVESKDRLAAQFMQNNITAQVGSEPAYYDTCDKCCYHYTTIEEGIITELNDAELRERGCTKRLPDAIIFGVKKGGTTTLRNFISYHPDIAFAQKELKFFTSSTERQKGLGYYKNQMTYSTPNQISMEKTPAYYHYPKSAAYINQSLPNVKLIIIVRDPIQRAVSDYVHLLVTIFKQCKRADTNTLMSTLENITLPADCNYHVSYNIKDTFERSVLDPEGNIVKTSQLISKGVYVRDIKAYLKYFPRDQILALDGESFIHDPYPAVKKVERFLGIRDYFRRDHFYFDDQKGFFCLDKPIPKNCMNPSKGRPHPVVREETLQKLRDYYRPYNAALKKLLNLDINWSS